MVKYSTFFYIFLYTRTTLKPWFPAVPVSIQNIEPQTHPRLNHKRICIENYFNQVHLCWQITSVSKLYGWIKYYSRYCTILGRVVTVGTNHILLGICLKLKTMAHIVDKIYLTIKLAMHLLTISNELGINKDRY